jgi:FkbM family methyltransferase
VASDDTGALIEVESTFGRIAAFENDFITNQIIKFGAHTRPELAFLLSVVHADDYIFDLGAHIGTFTIPLAQKTGEAGKVLAVEARRQTFSVLAKNITNSRLLAETTALHSIIAPSARRYEAHTPDGNTGGTFFLPIDGVCNVETATIDELCQRYFTPRILKIDIEGYEYLVLAGTKMLQRERPIVYAEVNCRQLRQQGTSPNELGRLFQENGYRLFRNIGDRNAAHDNFVASELSVLTDGTNNFDVLAIHCGDERLKAAIDAMSGR